MAGETRLNLDQLEALDRARDTANQSFLSRILPGNTIESGISDIQAAVPAVVQGAQNLGNTVLGGLQTAGNFIDQTFPSVQDRQRREFRNSITADALPPQPQQPLQLNAELPPPPPQPINQFQLPTVLDNALQTLESPPLSGQFINPPLASGQQIRDNVFNEQAVNARNQQLTLGGSPAQLGNTALQLRPSTNGQAFANNPVNPFQAGVVGDAVQTPLDAAQTQLNGLQRRATTLARYARQAADLAAGSGSGAIGQAARARATLLADQAAKADALVLQQLDSLGGIQSAQIRADAGLEQQRLGNASQENIAQQRIAQQAQEANQNFTLGRLGLEQQGEIAAADREESARQAQRQQLLQFGLEDLRQQGRLQLGEQQFALGEGERLARAQQQREATVNNAVRSIGNILPDTLANDPLTGRPDPRLSSGLQQARVIYLKLIGDGVPQGEALQQALSTPLSAQ